MIPLLALDLYQCHMMSLAIGSIQQLGVEVEHISGGCISLFHVDIGINVLLEATIIILGGLDAGFGNKISVIKPTMRQLIGEWMMKVYTNVTVEVVKNSWWHGNYSWFDHNYLCCILSSNHNLLY